MAKIWLILMIISISVLIFVSPALVVTEMISSANSTVLLCLELIGVYAVWLGLLEIVDKTGLSNKLSKFMSPFISKLFKTNDEKAKKFIAINLSSNLLGLGNASTPSGINAMKQLDDKSGKANYSSIMLLIINCCAIQIIPTTIIGLRASAGSQHASDILLPTLISSTTVAIVGVLLVILTHKFKRKNK